MKSLFKIFAVILLTVGFLNAEPINQDGQKDGYDIKLSSQKSLIVGTNALDIEISKDGVVLNDVKVKMKIFMPEMPGMPYMEYEDKATLENGVYKVNINFSMSGTWQYHLKFKTKDDAVHTVKGSINL